MCRREDEVRTKLRPLTDFFSLWFWLFIHSPSAFLRLPELGCQKFKGHWGQVAVRAGASGSLGTSKGRGRGSMHRQRSHNHASCVWFGNGSQDLSLCASQTFSQGYPIFPLSFHSLRRLLPAPDSQPHTNGLNKGPAWLGHVFWRNPKE